MSLTADIADAIIDVDRTLAKYEMLLNRLSFVVPDASDALADMAPEWAELKEAIEGLQEIACGEGMHFNSREEAFASRDHDPIEYREIIERPTPPV